MRRPSLCSYQWYSALTRQLATDTFAVNVTKSELAD
jgi:hypothetical protein